MAINDKIALTGLALGLAAAPSYSQTSDSLTTQEKDSLEVEENANYLYTKLTDTGMVALKDMDLYTDDFTNSVVFPLNIPLLRPENSILQSLSELGDFTDIYLGNLKNVVPDSAIAGPVSPKYISLLGLDSTSLNELAESLIGGYTLQKANQSMLDDTVSTSDTLYFIANPDSLGMQKAISLDTGKTWSDYVPAEDTIKAGPVTDIGTHLVGFKHLGNKGDESIERFVPFTVYQEATNPVFDLKQNFVQKPIYNAIGQIKNSNILFTNRKSSIELKD